MYTWTRKIKTIDSRLGFSHILSNSAAQLQAFIKHMQARINGQVLQEQDSFILNSIRFFFL